MRATEVVWCADADGVIDTMTWQGHDGALTDLDVALVGLEAGPVSEEDLLGACARRFRWLTGATVCEAHVAAPELDRYAATSSVFERYGQTGSDRPGFPVVVRGRVSCEDVQMEAGPAAALAEAGGPPVADQLRDWQSTDRFNTWRTREAMWREATDRGCLDFEAARQQALTAQADLEGDWPVFQMAPDPEHPSHAGLCLDVGLQRQGFIQISYQAVEGSHGRDAGDYTGGSVMSFGGALAPDFDLRDR